MIRPQTKLWVFVLIIFIVTENLQTSSLIINEDGGYDIVLAIKNDEPKPTNIDAYINNIKGAFTTLSDKMWIATRENFFIHSLEIILPQSWGVTGDVSPVSYVTADIRISSDKTSPYVENRNLCGQPGDYIELPKGFFDSANYGTFGEHWKVLLVEWARYRWGAYEEHGTPGDKRFPYFTRDFEAEEDEPKWLLNGCTNAPDNKLVGEYRKLDGTVCDLSSSTELDTQCRFYPDKSANLEVTSSLMHFHFMDSVYQFCDKNTHQKHVPTKQNLYCDNKSVMETIESSPDYKAIDQEKKLGYVPNLKTTVSVSPSTPAIYILLDNSLEDSADIPLVNQVVIILAKFINDIDVTVHKDLMVGVGQFPSTETDRNLEPTVPLALLTENRDDIVDAIGNRQDIVNPSHDFGVAIQQAAAAIRAVSPVEGGNILYLKTSGARNSEDFSSEKELELALRRDNIKLFALEIVDVNKARQNLVQIATATSGDSIALSPANLTQLPLAVSVWLEQKVLAEYDTAPVYNRPERIVYSGEVSPNINYAIPVLAGTSYATIILQATNRLNTNTLFAGAPTPETTIWANFAESRDYGQNRYVYIGILDSSAQTFNEVAFNFSGTNPHHLTILSDGAHLPADISLAVLTNAKNNHLDLGNIHNPDVPFVVTAIITQNNVPVVGAKVIATIRLGETWEVEIELLDESCGLPNPAGDGFYSEIVLLPRNGDYSISVVATKAKAAVAPTTVLLDGGTTLLLPPDQSYPPVEPVEFPTGEIITGSLGAKIHVTNTESYVPHIQTIRDLSIDEESMNNEEVTLELTAPRLFELGNADGGPNIYIFYVSQRYDPLIDLDPQKLPEGVTVAEMKVGVLAPGTPFSVTHKQSANDIPLYFAAVTYLNNEIVSHVSNIVTLPRMEDGEETTAVSDETTTVTVETTPQTTTVTVETTPQTTTVTDETTTETTTEPVETTTVTSTERVETTTVNTTEPVETTTVNTTEPVETTTVTATEPVETTTVTATEPVETTTVTSTEPVETTTVTTTEPAETTMVTTTERVETTTVTATEPVETTTVTSTEPVETTTVTATEPAETTSVTTTEPVETTMETTTISDETTAEITTMSDETTMETTIVTVVTNPQNTTVTEETTKETTFMSDETTTETTTVTVITTPQNTTVKDETTTETITMPDETTMETITMPDETTMDTSTVSDATTPETSTGGEQEEPEEEKPWIKSTGGIITIVAVVLACLAAAGGAYWYMNKRRSGSMVVTV